MEPLGYDPFERGLGMCVSLMLRTGWGTEVGSGKWNRLKTVSILATHAAPGLWTHPAVHIPHWGHGPHCPTRIPEQHCRQKQSQDHHQRHGCRWAPCLPATLLSLPDTRKPEETSDRHCGGQRPWQGSAQHRVKQWWARSDTGMMTLAQTFSCLVVWDQGSENSGFSPTPSWKKCRGCSTSSYYAHLVWSRPSSVLWRTLDHDSYRSHLMRPESQESNHQLAMAYLKPCHQKLLRNLSPKTQSQECCFHLVKLPKSLKKSVVAPVPTEFMVGLRVYVPSWLHKLTDAEFVVIICMFAVICYWACPVHFINTCSSFIFHVYNFIPRAGQFMNIRDLFILRI